MSLLSHQSAINPNRNFWVPEGSGGGSANVINTSTINANTMTVSTIGNLFNYTGFSTTTFQPIFFDQLSPVGAQMPKMEIKLRQRALDAGAVQSLRWGTDFKAGTAYINSEWDGYIPMPLVMNVQDLKVNDENGTNLIVNNNVVQAPTFSSITMFTSSINGQSILPSVTLTATSNYSNAFTFNPGSNVTLLSYDFPGITAGTYEYSVPISFNTSNGAGVVPLILGVYGGTSPTVDSNTTCIFDQKTNDFVFYTLRGQVYTNALNPAIVVSGTCSQGFDIDVFSFSGPQTAVIKKIA